MYVILLAILILIAVIAVFSLIALSNYRKRRILPTIDTEASAIDEYFRYLSSITLGAASGESAKAYCKAKSLWENVCTPKEALAAFQVADGVSRIILEDIKDMFDKDAYEEIKRGYLFRKNNLLWAISRQLKSEKNNGTWDYKELEAGLSKAKNSLFVRFYHRIKPYPRPWEID
ncbi:MAG TPA: hypothetical protein ENN75_00365 [candidate division Zixibacteria bacterium]|nr:hypothetical protein [candidate division Zixibacteria bacterium]